MKTKNKPKKVAGRPAAKDINVNVEVVEQLADDAIATLMAFRSLIRMLAEQLEARK